MTKWIWIVCVLAGLMAAGMGEAEAQGITSSTPDISVVPTPGGGYAIGTLAPVSDKSAAGGPIVGTSAEYIVKIGNFPYTLPQAGSTGFPSGDVLLSNVAQSAGVATITATGSVFEGAGGTSTLLLSPGDWAAIVVDGSNYLTLVGHYVSSGTPLPPALKVNGSVSGISVPVGSVVTITVANGPGNANDWIGVAGTGMSTSQWQWWTYLNARSSIPAAGMTGATVFLKAPAAGSYEARFYLSGGYTLGAPVVPFTTH